MDDEIIGKVFGCFQVDKVERHTFPSGHAATMCHGHCIHCGAPVARTLSELKRNPPKHCKNCPKWSRAEPPKVHPGQEFPGLVVLAMVGEPKGIATMWRCRCKVCGIECIVDQSHLKVYKSCGCLSKKEREAGLDFYRSLCKDGTCYSSLLESRKINKNSSTGVRGVCRGHRKAYRAYISIRRKHISLGEYDTLEEAAAARKAGEEKYFSPERAAFEADGVTVKGPYKPKKGENKKMDRKNILSDYEFTREDYAFVEAVMSQHKRDLIAKAEEKKQELLRYKKSMSEDMSRAIESIFDPVPMYEPITEEDEEDYARRQREYEAQCEENIQRLLKEAEYAGSLSVKARMLHSFGDELANN